GQGVPAECGHVDRLREVSGGYESAPSLRAHPMKVGSGSKVMPKAFSTPATIVFASSMTSAVLACPRFVSARVCLSDSAARPAPRLNPLENPACSISQAAEVFVLPSIFAPLSGSVTGYRGASAGRVSGSSTMGLVKKDPADHESWSSGSSTIPFERR